MNQSGNTGSNTGGNIGGGNSGSGDVVGAARPKQVFYGNNRADFSFIPGNVAPQND
jgi:hypothetical protein